MPTAQIPDLSGSYAPLTVSGKGVVRKDELIFNVNDYGAIGDSVADDSTATLAAFAVVPAKGGTVYFPPTQTYYKMTQPFPNRSGITVRGDSRDATRIRWTVGSMLAPTTGLSNLVFEDIYIDSASSAALIDLGATGGLFHCVFNRVRIVMYGLGSQIIKQNGSGSFLENRSTEFDFYRQTDHTVPAFDIINSGGAANSNVWANGRASSNNCNSTPFGGWRTPALPPLSRMTMFGATSWGSKTLADSFTCIRTTLRK